MYGVIDLRHYWMFYDDFFGAGTFGAAAAGSPWVVTDTSSSGTPTVAVVDMGEATTAGAQGVVQMTLDSGQTEVENLCLSFGDKLCFDIDKIRGFECRVKMGQATLDSNSQVAFGLTGDRNDTIDTIAYQALYRVIGADSTTAVVAESDDGTVDNNDIATGQTLINSWRVFKMEFFAGQSAVMYCIDDIPCATDTTFDLSNYHAGLQPFFQLQKSSDSNGDSLLIDYVKIWGVR